MITSKALRLSSLSFLACDSYMVLLAYAEFAHASYSPLFSDDIVFLLMGAFACITAIRSCVTMVGVLRLRPWARTAVLWLCIGTVITPLLPVCWSVYVAATAPDVFWSWEASLLLLPGIVLAVWWLIFFTRPKIKIQFVTK